MKQLMITAMLAMSIVTMVSCSDDDSSTPTLPASPIAAGSTVEIRNTLQIAADPSAGGTGGAELPIETVFSAPAGTFELSATVGSAIEFDNYLDTLYDINISEASISFDLVAAADHSVYQAFFRTIEAGTFDRYYLTFPKGHNITSSTSSNTSASLSIINDKEVVVAIGEGWSFNPGSTFTITLN